MIDSVAPARLLLAIAGFLIWSSAFVLLYGVNAIGCEWGWRRFDLGPLSLQRGALIVIWVVHLGALGAVLLTTWRGLARAKNQGRLERFLGVVALGANVGASVATGWIAIPLIGLSACA